MILLLLNERLAAWLPAAADPPGRVLARVWAGEWQPPAGLARRLALAPGVVFSACCAGGAVVIHAGRAGAPLTADQVRVLQLMGQGLAGRQIARAMGRSPRWVRYQVAAIKRRRARGI